MGVGAIVVNTKKAPAQFEGLFWVQTQKDCWTQFSYCLSTTSSHIPPPCILGWFSLLKLPLFPAYWWLQSAGNHDCQWKMFFWKHKVQALFLWKERKFLCILEGRGVCMCVGGGGVGYLGNLEQFHLKFIFLLHPVWFSAICFSSVTMLLRPSALLFSIFLPLENRSELIQSLSFFLKKTSNSSCDSQRNTEI